MLGKCSYNVMIYNWVGMIDHGTLLDCLSSWFNAGGVVLDSFKSYLSDCVKIDSILSDSK